MRKLTVWIMGLVMAFSLTACSNTKEKAASETKKTTTEAAKDTENAKESYRVLVSCANLLDHKDDLKSNYDRL